MSTAVIISGQMRSFAQTYATQKWHVYRHYPDLHFFVSCVDDAQAESAELLRKDYEHVHIEHYTDPELPPIDPKHEAHAPYANAASSKALMLQHWGNQRAWKFLRGKVGYFVQGLRTVIRIRPDNFIHRFSPPLQPLTDTAFTPWWGRFGGINDRLAVMGQTAAYHYFDTYSKIERLMELGCPFHPESLVRANLQQMGVTINETLQAEFSTHRIAGDPRPHRPPEISASDIADLILNR